ncbi:MAG TPA: hypothetical protein ENG51_09410 [Deltaproteobacteria bacterium]|nr:hypothetical protein [Deltaproteobacteria bacterium]
MAYRRFDTGTWDDPWFESLSVKAKLLFIFLFTNNICNQAGLYEISTKKIKANLDFDPTDVFQELQSKVAYYPKHNIVWVKNFLRWQCQNESFLKGAVNSLPHTDSTILREFYRYNKDLFEKYNVEIKIPEPQHCVNTVSTQCLDSEPTVPSSEQNRTDTEQNRTEYILYAQSDNDLSAPSPVLSIPLVGKNGKSFSITQEMIDHWQEDFPGIDVLTELKKCKAWNEANPTRRKTEKGIKRHIVAWLSRAQDSGKTKKEDDDDPFRLVREKYGKAE